MTLASRASVTALGASTSDEGYLSGTCTIGPAEVTPAMGPIGNTAATAR